MKNVPEKRGATHVLLKSDYIAKTADYPGYAPAYWNEWVFLYPIGTKTQFLEEHWDPLNAGKEGALVRALGDNRGWQLLPLDS